MTDGRGQRSMPPASVAIPSGRGPGSTDGAQTNVAAPPPAASVAAPGLGRMPDFALERFFDRFEFDLPFQVGSSDPETLPLRELLDLADDEMLSRWEALGLGYRTSAGDPMLREAIAATYPGRGPDDVLVAVGAAEALLVAFAATIEPGDRVVALSPAYQSLHEVPRAIGARLDLVPVQEGEGARWWLRADDLLGALVPGVRVLVLNVPHNPTGVTLAADELDAVVEKCERLGIRVIGDEVYRGLEWTGDTPPSVTELSDSAIAVGVTSKVYGLAGLRIGWLVTGDRRVRARAMAIKDYTTLCAAGPSEVLATIALRAHDELRARTRARCAANLVTLESFVASHPDMFAWRRPAAATISVARIAPRLLARHGGDPERVFAQWRERAGVVVAPGTAFGCRPDRFRLGFGRANLPEALAALAAAV
jgi:aspartate/methionine/tyrosine aminotransferase